MQIVLGHAVSHQVVFAGPFGVGKTTALRAVSDIAVVNTDVATLEASNQSQAEGKSTTTTGLDYGEWQFPDGTRVSLIGVPGQDRFEAMWDVLIPRSSAIVLWLYGDSPNRLRDASHWLQALAQRKALARLAVAVTRVPDDRAEAVLQPFREVVGRFHPLAPVITADPRRPADVMQAIMIALTSPYAAIERQ